MFASCDHVSASCGEPGLEDSLRRTCCKSQRNGVPRAGINENADETDLYEPNHILSFFAEACGGKKQAEDNIPEYPGPHAIASRDHHLQSPHFVVPEPAESPIGRAMPGSPLQMKIPMRTERSTASSLPGLSKFFQLEPARADVSMVLDRTCWCWYCLCGGVGCSAAPLHTNLMCKCICCIATCEAIRCCKDGLCSCIHTACCCTLVHEMPPREGSPCCIFLGRDCCDCCGPTAGKSENSTRADELADGDTPQSTTNHGDQTFNWDNALFENILWDSLCYCCCMGISIEKQCRLCRSGVSCACWHCRTMAGPPCHLEALDGCCALLWSCWWDRKSVV